MKTWIKITVFAAFILFAGFPLLTEAQVAGSYWLLSSGSIKPVNSAWTLTLPYLGGSGSGCVSVTNAGLLGFTSCGGSGGSGNVATSSSETSSYIPFWTSTASTPATLSGGTSAFRWLSPGFMSLATTTIGDGSQTGGLTVSGTATTTQLVVENRGLITKPAITIGTPDLGFYSNGSTELYELAGGKTLTWDSAAFYGDTGTDLGTSGNPWNHFFADFASTTAQTSSYASSTVAHAGTQYVEGLGTPAGTFVAADPNGKLIATSTPGGSGTVTSVATTWPISGGTITTTGTITWAGIATSTAISAPQLLYATGVNTFSSVATSTLTATSPLTGSLTQIGSGGSLGCQTASGSQAGCLSSADWTTFNSKQAALTFTYPLVNSANTVSTAFGTTTDTGIGNNLFIYTSAGGVLKGAASSTLDLPNSALQNSATTVSGQTCTLGSTCTLANLTATDGTLTFSGTYNGSTARTIGLNLGNANTWTVPQTFNAGALATAVIQNSTNANGTAMEFQSSGVAKGFFGYSSASSGYGFWNAAGDTVEASIDFTGKLTANSAAITYASTTQFTAASQAFYINSSGKVTLTDSTTGYTGQLTPVRAGMFKIATTTTWTASTSEPYDWDAPAPFTGTIKDITCFTDAGTVDVELTDGSSHAYLLSASTTANTNTLSLSMTKNDKLNAIVGNPASSPTWVTCNLDAVQTP